MAQRRVLESRYSHIHHPVMLASLFLITLVPFGLPGARNLGFSPTTQNFTALETSTANLYWSYRL